MRKLFFLLAVFALVPLAASALSSTNRVETSNYLCSGSLVKNLTATGATFDSISESELPSDYTTSDKYCIRQTKTTQCAGAGGATTYTYALYNTSAQMSYVQAVSCNLPSGLDSNGDPIFPKTGPAKVWTNTLRYISPTATLTASPATITPGSSSLLTWSSNQSSCTGTGFSTNNAAAGSVSVSPSSSTTYTVTCGSVTKSVTVSVVPPVTLTASANSTSAYTPVTLTWSSVGASYCESDEFTTFGDTSGTINVSPGQTSTYTIRCFSSSSTSGPGTWQSTGPDYSDYWCNYCEGGTGCTMTGHGGGVQLPESRVRNTCGSNVSAGGACNAPDSCVTGSVVASCGVASEWFYCAGSGASVLTGSASQTISVTGGAPTTPTLTCPATATVGVAANVTFSASDPDGDQIRYGADWDGNSTVDEWNPASGYVNSGTSKTFSHTFTTVGSVTVKGLAQDQGGSNSGWAQCTVDVTAVTQPECNDAFNNDPSEDSYNNYPADPGCTSLTDPTEFPNPQCSDGINNNANPAIDCQEAACHTDGNVNNPASCNAGGTSETPAGTSQCNDGQDNDGANGADADDPGCHLNNDLTQAYDPNDNVEKVPAATLSITAAPLRVNDGFATLLTWTSTNVKSCTVTGDNGDSWSGKTGTNQPSSPLIHQTIFTLKCTDLANVKRSASVKVKINGQIGEE